MASFLARARVGWFDRPFGRTERLDLERSMAEIAGQDQQRVFSSRVGGAQDLRELSRAQGPQVGSPTVSHGGPPGGCEPRVHERAPPQYGNGARRHDAVSVAPTGVRGDWRGSVPRDWRSRARR